MLNLSNLHCVLKPQDISLHNKLGQFFAASCDIRVYFIIDNSPAKQMTQMSLVTLEIPLASCSASL